MTDVNDKPERLGILVGVGPAPGINSVISAVTIDAQNPNLDVIDFYDVFALLTD